MLRVIDTGGLDDVRTDLTTIHADLSERRARARAALIRHGRPDVTWRLGGVETWLAAASQQLAWHIEAARMSIWMRTEPGKSATPPPVTAWDAVWSALGPTIAAGYLEGRSRNEQRLIARWRSSTLAVLESAPLFARVEANRTLIEAAATAKQEEINALQDALEDFPSGTTAHRWRVSQIAELAQQQAILQRLANRNPIWFEPGEDGRYLEWIGPADAEHVVVFVPGTGHSVWTADDLLGTGSTLRDSATSLRVGGVAVIVAMGYDAPNHVPAAAFSSYAEQGGPELARILDTIGIGDDRHVTLLGHSYGSFVATAAVPHLDRLQVDDLVLIGSPGVGVDSVDEIPLDPTHVWVGLTDNDSITLTSSDRWLTWLERIDLNPFDWTTWDVRRDGTYEDLWFGTNPAHPSFGAQRLEMFDADGHSGYFGNTDQNDAALENLARVFVGLSPVLDD